MDKQNSGDYPAGPVGTFGLSSRKRGGSSVKVYLLEAESQRVILRNVDLIQDIDSADLAWFHGAFDIRAVSKMLGKIPMVFYGEAAASFTELIEGASRIRRQKIIKTDDPWDKRGFQSYKYHPLFEQLHGGFYSYIVLKETDEDVFYYNGQKAKVIAVEKRYISVIKQNSIIWEYDVEGKKVLCIGGYLNFESSHIAHCVDETHKLVENVLRYLSAPTSSGSYWSDCSNDSRLDRTLKINDVVLYPVDTTRLKPPTFIVHEGTGDDYNNLCGRRILVNLRENGTFDEVWIHPFRFLKKLHISVDGKRIEEYNVFHRIYPDRVVHDADKFSMISFVSLEKPLLMIEIDFRDDEPHKVEIEAEIDTRIMWPFGDDYNCGRSFNYDEQKGQVLVRTKDGSFSGFVKVDSSARMSFTAEKESVLFRIIVRKSNFLCLCVGGFMEQETFPKSVDFTEELNLYAEFVEDYLKKTVQIESDCESFDRLYEFAKIGTVKFLVSTPRIGEGLVAGYANSKPGWFSARPGYAWYFGRDSEWVSLALLNIGDWETVKKNLDLLMKYQRIDGKIYHELTTSNVVHYDASDSTPLFLLTFYRYVEHTHDVEFLIKNWPSIVKAFHFCLSTDRDQDGLIENTIDGHGWIEGGKLYGSHAELYLNAIWLATVRGMKEMAQMVGDTETIERAEQTLEKVSKAMRKFYDERTGLYMLGIKQNGERLNYFTVMTAVAVYMEAMDFEESKKQVLPYATSDFSTDWGVRIIGKSSGLFNPNGYHEGTVWPLFTGWVSLAELRAGATLSGFTHVLSNLVSAKHFAKGYISEVYHGEFYKPSGICPHQAWSESMAIQPLIEGMIGFKAHAMEQKCVISPQIPWNIGKLNVKNLKVGDVSVCLNFQRQQIGENRWREEYRISCSDQLKIDLSVWIPKQSQNLSILGLDPISPIRSFDGVLSTKLEFGKKQCDSMEIVVEYDLPFELRAVEPNPLPFSSSSTFRLVSVERLAKDFEIKLEASSQEKLLKGLFQVLKLSSNCRMKSVKPFENKEGSFSLILERL